MSLSDILVRVRKAEEQAGRAAGSVDLVAISKVQPLERVTAVLDQGHRLFGENKVQEAAGKWPDLKEQYEGVTLHLVGPLQTNKARQSMQLFNVIETLDRSKLAKTFARLRDEGLPCPELFLQVNTGEEPQKAGAPPQDADALAAECRALELPLVGAMCIPPADEEPALHFALLKKIAERNGLSRLSMGMSADFETAIAQGATSVRVGSAIFGDRVYS
ncbi:MAG: YggS family pyridoxal phosphate-dependent enzyme [Pseudomonadota bacterium]